MPPLQFCAIPWCLCLPVILADLPPSVQFETLAGFSAVIDRLGEFMEVLEEASPADASPAAPLQDQAAPLLPPASSIQVSDEWQEGAQDHQFLH